MAFAQGRRNGSLWDDANKLNDLISSFDFYTTSKTERDFEIGLATVLQREGFSNKVITQISKEEAVNSVYCFGKKHRPDMTIENDGIAIELKFVDKDTDALKQVIGQSILYRQKYKFETVQITV